MDQAWFVVVGQPTLIYAYTKDLEVFAPLFGVGGIRRAE
jgi:hypothetical protein